MNASHIVARKCVVEWRVPRAGGKKLKSDSAIKWELYDAVLIKTSGRCKSFFRNVDDIHTYVCV